jgi:hypothetical protein
MTHPTVMAHWLRNTTISVWSIGSMPPICFHEMMFWHKVKLTVCTRTSPGFKAWLIPQDSSEVLPLQLVFPEDVASLFHDHKRETKAVPPCVLHVLRLQKFCCHKWEYEYLDIWSGGRVGPQIQIRMTALFYRILCENSSHFTFHMDGLASVLCPLLAS